MNVLPHFIRVAGLSAEKNTLHAALVLIILIALAGCETVEVRSTEGYGPIVLPGSVERLRHASIAKITADPRRLEADIPRAVRRCEWGLERLSVERAKPSENPDFWETYRVIQATARTPSDQTVTIFAWGQDDWLRVMVRVGPFGEAPEELEFIEALNEILRGRAIIPRGGKFELPE